MKLQIPKHQVKEQTFSGIGLLVLSYLQEDLNRKQDAPKPQALYPKSCSTLLAVQDEMKKENFSFFKAGLQSIPAQTDVYDSDGEGIVSILYLREKPILSPGSSILGGGNPCLIQRIKQHREAAQRNLSNIQSFFRSL